MGISRFVFKNFYHPETMGEETDTKEETAFEKILQKEYNQLMQLVKDSQKNGTTVELYQKCNPWEFENMLPEE